MAKKYTTTKHPITAEVELQTNDPEYNSKLSDDELRGKFRPKNQYIAEHLIKLRELHRHVE